jgi:NADH-quinone oxidoreductase subunit N
MNSTDVLVLLPVIIVAVTAVLVMLVAAFRRSHRLVLVLTLIGLLLAFIALLIVGPWLPRQVTPLIIVDGYAVFYMGLLLVGTAFVAVLSYSYVEKYQGQREEFYLLLLLATLGSCVLVISDHFMSFFLGLELLSISLYALIAYLRQQEHRIEAGIKYLVLAGAAAATLLLGMALIYAEIGTMSFTDMLAQPMSSGAQGLLLVGAGLIALGVSFKLGLVPLHIWTPDVYQGAPAPVTGFVSTVSKGGMLALALRYFPRISLSENSALWLLIAAIAIASMLFGNILAVRQDNVKRMLAYSSITHFGYLLIPLLAVGPLSQSAAAFYLAGYFAMTLSAFGVVTALSTPDREAEDFEDYRGLFWRSPWLSIALVVALLSLAGIPPTAGLLGKVYIMIAGVEAGVWLLLFVLVISSIIGIFYYMRLTLLMFRNQPADQPTLALPRLSRLTGAALIVLSGLVIWWGIYPTAFIQFIQTLMIQTI